MIDDLFRARVTVLVVIAGFVFFGPPVGNGLLIFRLYPPACTKKIHILIDLGTFLCAPEVDPTQSRFSLHNNISDPRLNAAAAGRDDR